MNVRRTISAVVIGAAAVAAVAAPASASSSPVDYVDPSVQGSTTDIANLLNTATSDAGAQPSHVSNTGCVSASDRPRLTPAPASPTGFDVTAQIATTCLLLSGRNTFELQRSLWYGWQSLATTTVTTQPAAVSASQISTHCRAGTWSYRVRSSGTNGFHTPAARYTCVQRDDAFFIDAA